ncbi:MAG: hypothetical protein RJA39_1184, partial [Pseudomonadota bacterium]
MQANYGCLQAVGWLMMTAINPAT